VRLKATAELHVEGRNGGETDEKRREKKSGEDEVEKKS